LELQRKNENKDSKWSIQTVFKTILKCREKMKTMYLKHASRQYLKRFATAEKNLKAMNLNGEF